MVPFAVLTSACGRVGFDILAGPDGRPPIPCPIDATTIFCDDFEGPGFSRWDLASGVLTRVTSGAHTGSGAAQVSIANAPEHSWFQASPAALAQALQLSIRTWVYVTAGSSLGHVNFITVRNPVTDQELTVLWYAESLDIYRRTSSVDGYSNSTVLERERWTCVEVDITVDDAAGGFEIRVDGAPVLQQGAIDTQADGRFDVIQFGLPFSEVGGQLGAVTIYVDDFYVGTTAVGCD